MEETEKLKIRELRLSGMGYKAIGLSLGMSRDSVRGYCIRAGLNGSAETLELNIMEKEAKSEICPCCGKPVKQKKQGRTRRFCSEECRRKWWNDNPDKRNKKESAIYKYTCPYCNKEFSCYGNKRRKYCSNDCYIKSRFI